MRNEECTTYPHNSINIMPNCFFNFLTLAGLRDHFSLNMYTRKIVPTTSIYKVTSSKYNKSKFYLT